MKRVDGHDSISAASTSDVQDRLSSLELRVQQQEDELTVMKAALADVLRRLAQSEDAAAAAKKQQSSKGQTPLREAYSMSCIANGSSSVRKSHRDSSTVSIAKKGTLSSAAKSAKRGGMERSQSSTWDSGEENRNKLVKAASTSKLLSKVVKNNIFPSSNLSTEGEYIKMFMRGRPITMFIPSDVENYDDVRTELPPERLKLEWVYGYRGRDCRANVYLLPTGEIVYFIASVVVLFNYEERTQRHYLGHTDCVKCLAVHPDKIRIATGQIAGVDKDGRPLQPHVRVWDSVSLSTLQIIGLGTFERGVGSLAFSKADSGIHLSVIDDSNEHMLTVWDWQKKSKIAEIKTTNEVVLAVEFHPTDANTIVTCGKSHIFFWTWSGSSLARKQGIFGVRTHTLIFLMGNLKDGSPSVLLTHPIPTGAFQITRQIKAHDGSVFTLCQMRNGTLLTGGGKDHKIILWDHDLNPERDIEVPDQYGTIRAVAEGKGEQFLVGTSRNFILRGTFNDGFQVEVQGHTDELWGLAAHPFKDLFLTCAQDRQVCLWNSVYHTLEWTRLLDVRLLQTHICIHIMFSFSFFIVKSFNLRLQGHSSYITHLDWSPDNKFIMSNSGDYEILYWDIPNGCKLIRNRSECKDIDWATYTCVLGFHVFGVWPEGSDGTDINALVRSHNRKVIALADDFCKVHLFQYPCSRPKAPSHKYSAHSSHVTNVSFMHSDSNLISTGGKDMSIMQWRLVEKTSSLVHSDSSLGLGDSLLHNSTPRTLASVPSVPHTPTEPMPVPASLPISSQPNTNTPPLTPPEPLHTVTPNGQQDGSPETPPPSDEATPTSDSTLSPKDSLEPSDDTATPSDEGTTFNPPL
uniref:EMAP like 4 n=1 Tax=Sinocyclocheilus grahami TaxID=75366 RepID=A0A672TCA8_SINGR